MIFKINKTNKRSKEVTKNNLKLNLEKRISVEHLLRNKTLKKKEGK